MHAPGGAAADVVAVDLGGTKTTAALVGADGAVRGERTVATPASEGPDAVLGAVAALVDEVVGSAGAAGPDGSVTAVGVGTAGVVDVDRGVILSATDAMPGWAGTPVAARLRTRLAARWGHDVGVHVQNDVDAHGAGEAWRGAGRGAGSVLMVTVGTGIGASVVLGGEARHGAHWSAGELGHVPVPGAEGVRCGCGRTGHLEAVASGTAVARRYSALAGEVVDGREVVLRAGRGDAAAADLVAEAATALGRALAGAITLLDPDVVVIGGGFAAAGPSWWDAVLASARTELIPVLRAVPIVPTSLGAHAPLVGAARSARTLLPHGPEVPA